MRRGAFGQKALSSPFLLPAEQRRRAWAPAAVLAGGPGHGDGRVHGGKRKRDSVAMAAGGSGRRDGGAAELGNGQG